MAVVPRELPFSIVDTLTSCYDSPVNFATRFREYVTPNSATKLAPYYESTLRVALALHPRVYCVQVLRFEYLSYDVDDVMHTARMVAHPLMLMRAMDYLMARPRCQAFFAAEIGALALTFSGDDIDLRGSALRLLCPAPENWGVDHEDMTEEQVATCVCSDCFPYRIRGSAADTLSILQFARVFQLPDVWNAVLMYLGALERSALTADLLHPFVQDIRRFAVSSDLSPQCLVNVRLWVKLHRLCAIPMSRGKEALAFILDKLTEGVYGRPAQPLNRVVPFAVALGKFAKSAHLYDDSEACVAMLKKELPWIREVETHDTTVVGTMFRKYAVSTICVDESSSDESGHSFGATQ